MKDYRTRLMADLLYQKIHWEIKNIFRFLSLYFANEDQKPQTRNDRDSSCIMFLREDKHTHEQWQILKTIE